MGEVFLARDRGLPRCVALEVLPRAVAGDEDVRRRFQREADMVARLSHPNIVTIYARGEEEGRLWISMAYVDGPRRSSRPRAVAASSRRMIRSPDHGGGRRGSRAARGHRTGDPGAEVLRRRRTGCRG
ncbi:hypothetical protein [Nocardia higoensis]|nr:hypothetical protein [Nocardia higoensis]